jgi:hypothetical protein
MPAVRWLIRVFPAACAPDIETTVSSQEAIDVKQVIQASSVMPYEPYGFTNCVRFKDVLYLSGISAMDLQGRVMSVKGFHRAKQRVGPRSRTGLRRARQHLIGDDHPHLDRCEQQCTAHRVRKVVAATRRVIDRVLACARGSAFEALSPRRKSSRAKSCEASTDAAPGCVPVSIGSGSITLRQIAGSHRLDDVPLIGAHPPTQENG